MDGCLAKLYAGHDAALLGMGGPSLNSHRHQVRSPCHVCATRVHVGAGGSPRARQLSDKCTGIVTAAPPVLSTKHHVRNQGHFCETMLCVFCPRILGTAVHLPIAQVILLCQHLIVTGPRVGDSEMGRAEPPNVTKLHLASDACVCSKSSPGDPSGTG